MHRPHARAAAPPRRYPPRAAPLGLALLAALVLAACSGGPLPDFPDYPPTERYLAMQARQQAYQPPQPQPYPYTAKNAHILAQLQRAQAAARAELAYRERVRSEAERAARAPRNEDFEALRLRIARDELVKALDQQEREAYLGRAYARAATELTDYRDRVDRLRQIQEARRRQAAEDEVTYRQPKLEDWEAVRLRLARDQARQRLLEQQRIDNRRRANERSNTSIADYQARVERLQREKAAREAELERLATEAQQRRNAELQARIRQQAALRSSATQPAGR